MDIKNRLVILNNLRIFLPFSTTFPYIHLIEILKKAKSKYVRKNIIEVLGALRDKRAKEILNRIAIEDSNSEIREAARKSLSKIKD